MTCGRKLESSSVKAPIIRVLDLEQSTLSLGRETHIGDPQRSSTAIPIKCFKCRKICWVVFAAEVWIFQLRANALNDRCRCCLIASWLGHQCGRGSAVSNGTYGASPSES